MCLCVCAASLQEAEDSMRSELNKRTTAVLTMREQLEDQGAALAAATAQQQQLQGRVQVCRAGMAGIQLFLVPRAIPGACVRSCCRVLQ